MTKRDYLLGFWGAFTAFAVTSGTDGHWIAAGIFYAAGAACCLRAGRGAAKT